MNPYTQTLLRQVDYPQLAVWVEDWDRLEALVIRVYKGGAASPADEAEYRLLRARLQTAYPTWQAAFDRYWRQAEAGGLPVRTDPFAALLAQSAAGGFAGERSLLQLLPAARETINQYLVDLIKTNE